MTDEAIQIPLTNEEVDAISKGIAIPGQQVAQRMAAEIRFSRMRPLPTNAEVDALVKTAQGGLGYTWDGISRHRLEDADLAILKLASIARRYVTCAVEGK